MKLFVILPLFVAAATAVSNGDYDNQQPQIRGADNYRTSARFNGVSRFSQNIRGSLENVVSFSTVNGISLRENTVAVPRPGTYEDEQGRLVQTDTIIEKSGSYSYTNADGTPVTVSYQANENGFRAEGSHIPVPPAQIQKTPAVLQAELEHARLFQEVAAKSAASPDTSYVQQANPQVLRSSYAAPAAVIDFKPAQIVMSSMY